MMVSGAQLSGANDGSEFKVFSSLLVGRQPIFLIAARPETC
jgi:hypothetical protein